MITFHLQVAKRKQNGSFVTSAVIVSETFGPPVNQIAHYKRFSSERNCGVAWAEGSEKGKFGIKQVDRGQIATVKDNKKAKFRALALCQSKWLNVTFVIFYGGNLTLINLFANQIFVW